jgi:hypothetical protein
MILIWLISLINSENKYKHNIQKNIIKENK